MSYKIIILKIDLFQWIPKDFENVFESFYSILLWFWTENSESFIKW